MRHQTNSEKNFRWPIFYLNCVKCVVINKQELINDQIYCPNKITEVNKMTIKVKIAEWNLLKHGSRHSGTSQ